LFLGAEKVTAQRGPVAELTLRLRHRVPVAHASSAKICGATLDMKLPLVVEVLLGAPSSPRQPKDASNAWRDPTREQRHCSHLAGFEYA
jgi:hypothetical protein